MKTVDSARERGLDLRSLAIRRGIGVAFAVMGWLVCSPSHAQGFASIIQVLKAAQFEMSAFAVSIKQSSVSANQMAQSHTASQQQLATAIKAIGSSERLVKASIDYSGQFGQAITNGCRAQRQAELQTAAKEQATLDRRKLMATFSSGRLSSSSQSERERIQQRRGYYCTVGEAKAGMCELKANGMQGWDANYGGAFADRTVASESELAAYAFVATVADVRPTQQMDCKSAACSAASARQLRVAASSAMAADALLGQVADRRVPVLTGE